MQNNKIMQAKDATGEEKYIVDLAKSISNVAEKLNPTLDQLFCAFETIILNITIANPEIEHEISKRLKHFAKLVQEVMQERKNNAASS